MILRNDYCTVCAIINIMVFFTHRPVFKAISLGIIAGMRTFYAPAVLTHILSRHSKKSLHHSPLAFMQTMAASKVFKVLAAGELAGDKLPNAPNRTAFPGVTARCLSGILVGATVYQAAGRRPLTGGLIGGIAAAASTYGFFYLRKAIVKTSGIPDAYIGAAEDAVVIAGGIALTVNG